MSNISKISMKSRLKLESMTQMEKIQRIRIQKLEGGQRCNECQKILKDKASLKRHVTKEHQSFECEPCQESFKDNTALKKHERKKHFHYQCEPCKERFKDVKTIMEHQYEKHNGPNPKEHSYFQCVTHPDPPFFAKEDLNNHMKKFHNGIIIRIKDILCIKGKKNVRMLPENHQDGSQACRYCDQTYKSLFSLEKHLRNTHNVCNICNELFGTTEEVESHKKRVHQEPVPQNQETIQCKKCSFVVNLLNIDKHMESKHQELFNCELCNKKFKRISNLINHETNAHAKNDAKIDAKHDAARVVAKDDFKIDANEKYDINDLEVPKFSLNNFRFKPMEINMVHKNETIEANDGTIRVLDKQLCDEVVHPDINNKYLRGNKSCRFGQKCCQETFTQCKTCNKGFSNHSRAKKHTKTKHGDYLECRCKETFTTKDALLQHITEKNECHAKACHICGKIYSLLTNLTRHIKNKHEKETLTKCKYKSCHLSYNPKKLSAHMKEYHKRFIKDTCDICDIAFKTKSSFKRHKKEIHDKIKQEMKDPVKCYVCKKVFKSIPMLKIHFARIHGNMSTCAVCSKTFHTVKAAKKHFKDAHDGSFKCSMCHKSFEEIPNLRRHLSQKHNYASLSSRQHRSHNARVNCDPVQDRSGHKCKQCRKEFKTLPSLRKHFSKTQDHKHKGAKVEFSCDICLRWRADDDEHGRVCPSHYTCGRKSCSGKTSRSLKALMRHNITIHHAKKWKEVIQGQEIIIDGDDQQRASSIEEPDKEIFNIMEILDHKDVKLEDIGNPQWCYAREEFVDGHSYTPDNICIFCEQTMATIEEHAKAQDNSKTNMEAKNDVKEMLKKLPKSRKNRSQNQNGN